MKNLKKLFVAAIMLVVALTAVVSSTYAWFTMQNEVDVDDMSLNVGTAGLDLQVARTNDVGLLAYSVAYQPVGLLVPVTYINDDTVVGEGEAAVTYGAHSFKTTAIVSNKYAYTDASIITNLTAADAKGYIAYDLWFRSSEPLDLELDLSSLGFTTTGGSDLDIDAAVASVRIMFLMNENYVIYEPHYDPDHTYGTGRFFQDEEPYASSAWDYFLDYLAGDTATEEYTLKTAFANQIYTAQNLTYQSDGETERILVDANGDLASSGGVYTLQIGQLSANTMTNVKVYIWLEGWDGDAINVASGAAFNTHMIFKGFAQGKGNA